MGFLKAVASLNWQALLPYIINLLVALPCIVLHEMAHGFAAYKLGDTTAKDMGRLSLNPLRHIDPLGLIMMVTLGFGWAKPVRVDMRRFRNPKRGMALTALAGPACNFVLALIVLFIAGIIWRTGAITGGVGWYVFMILVFIAIRSTFLGIFNLIPIPPLDGSKALFSFLPDDKYLKLMRYERYFMIIVFALCYVGAVNRVINIVGGFVIEKFCIVTMFPPEVMALFI